MSWRYQNHSESQWPHPKSCTCLQKTSIWAQQFGEKFARRSLRGLRTNQPINQPNPKVTSDKNSPECTWCSSTMTLSMAWPGGEAALSERLRWQHWTGAHGTGAGYRLTGPFLWCTSSMAEATERDNTAWSQETLGLSLLFTRALIS